MRYLTLASMLLVANSALAESVFDRLDKFYVGGGLNLIDSHTRDAAGEKQNYTTFEIQGGYKYNGYLSGELRVGFGIADERFDTGLGTSVDTSIEYNASLYWRPETANEIAKIYGLLGVTTLSVEAAANGTSASESETGFSYGGGVGFTMSENWNMNFEYRWLLDQDENEFSSLGATLDYRF